MSTETLLRPRAPQRAAEGATSLAPDLLRQAAARLRILALLFGFAFLVLDFVASLFSADWRAATYGSLMGWAPGAVSIAAAAAIVWATTSPRVRPEVIPTLGLAFEIVGSFGIAVAQWWGLWEGVADLSYETRRSVGISWVAVWMVLFTIVVPTPPRKALLAAALSATAVPITLRLSMAFGGTPSVPAVFFFFAFVLPYAATVVLAYVGARAVYHLGTEVTRARELGSYQLVERLGWGGMGEVWRARHRLLARPAAVKLIRPDVLGSGHRESREVLLKRFEREAQATASMRCPHTIELYDFGVADDGTFYYVMELLDGFNLESLVARFGPLPAERLVYLLRQVCHSLSEAHERGLIHRDIKPANVYVCRLGRELDWIKVLDFGLVKTRPAPNVADVKLTSENMVEGTPAYMAPEQVTGDSPVDGRTDVYAVGCLTYWALTGHLVFEGRTPLETMAHHLNRAPTPPSHRTELPIPPALDQIVLTCLAKDPDQRPPSADALSQMLDDCSRDLPRWTAERARQWWDRHLPRPTLRSSDELLWQAEGPAH